MAFGFDAPFSDSITGASYVYAYFRPTSGGAEVWSDGSRRDGTSTINYAVSPESVTFTWPDTAALRTFVAADRQTATATSRSYRNGTDALLMELPFQHVLMVSYERQDPFTRESVPGTLRSTRVTLFFNEVTTSAAITTDLSYSGTAKVVGGKPGTTPPGVFTAELSTFTVAASDKKITGTIRIFENVNGTQTLRAVLPISGTVAANNAFSGNIDDTANGFKGTFAGVLAGPSREEIVILFNVAHTDGREFVGSLIGT
ncbi:hypothetical protein ACWPM1_06490 [Tsuneonella sp. HG249]